MVPDFMKQDPRERQVSCPLKPCEVRRKMLNVSVDDDLDPGPLIGRRAIVSPEDLTVAVRPHAAAFAAICPM